MTPSSDRGKEILRASTTKTSAHTLVRVRNNQRRHRERRRQYIASLEEKLRRTEILLEDANAKIAELEMQLKELHNEDSTIHHQNEKATEQAQIQQVGPPQVAVSNNRVSSHSEHPLDDSRLDSGTNQTVKVVTATLYQPPPPPAVLKPLGQSLSSSSAKLPHTTTSTDLQPAPSIYSQCCTKGDEQTTTIPDCSTSDIWVKSPSDSFAVSAPNTGEVESTTLCRDAYVLISQQNYRGLDTHNIRCWLEGGFRWGKAQEGGCRVSTVLLFSLLDFITYT